MHSIIGLKHYGTACLAVRFVDSDVDTIMAA